jgi:DNA gyrase subunit A
VLPARIPNLLINGSAVSRWAWRPTSRRTTSTRWSTPACAAAGAGCTIDELIKIIPAPDFPTAGIIYGLRRARRLPHRPRPRGHARPHPLRGHRQGRPPGDHRRRDPYQVNKKTLLEKIAELVNEKKIEGISDIRDESDKSGMRVVIELKRGEVPEVVLNNLYKQTQLQDTFGMNMVALVDGQPRLLNLRQMLECFLAHRREVVTRRTVFELRKARERGHPGRPGRRAVQRRRDHRPHQGRADAAEPRGADGAPVALGAGRGDARPRGRRRLPPGRAGAGVRPVGPGLPPSDAQAQAILELRLQRLTGLEQDKIVAEYREVMDNIADLLDILARPERITAIIGDELRSSSSSSATRGVPRW